MSYRVEFAGEFRDNVREQVAYMRRRGMSEQRIESWFGKLFDELDALRESPRRHPVDEVQSQAIGSPSHKKVYDGYLAFYRVDDERRIVRVDRFVHGARDRSKDAQRAAEGYRQRSRASDRDQGLDR